MDQHKQFKDQSNKVLKSCQNSEDNPLILEDNPIKTLENSFTFSTQTELLLKQNVSNEAFKNIKDIFEKTQSIKKVAKVKNQKIQEQFKELRERLNYSSECLQRMKKGIDNIKFSYQTKIFEMQRTLQPGDYFDPEKNPIQTKEDMTKHIEEIRDKIEKIQSQIHCQKEKQVRVTESYKEAFENVSSTLESINKGTYSTQKFEKDCEK